MGDMYLLEEMKKTLGKKQVSDAIPESLEGEVTEEGVVNKFKELYEALYNSCGSEDAMALIKDRLTGIVTADSISEVRKITGAAVKKACLRMKPGKCDVSETLSSDAHTASLS